VSINANAWRDRRWRSIMIINYVPGEECRVAIVEDGKLEELLRRAFDQRLRVGNIYVGKVVNVEPAIQAAFVDFGVGENGFLHISDLHPRYFPGEDEAPPSAWARRRPGASARRSRRPAPRPGGHRAGAEGGRGHQGPDAHELPLHPRAVPGDDAAHGPRRRLRKVEDEDQRRRCGRSSISSSCPRASASSCAPRAFGRTKTELKRDLAYLQRLWKDMERRRKSGSKPRLLYSESDLLVRSCAT
jgi:ribonuclease E